MQDYINLSLLLFAYATLAGIAIGISVCTVNYLLIRASKIENVNQMQQITKAKYQKMA